MLPPLHPSPRNITNVDKGPSQHVYSAPIGPVHTFSTNLRGMFLLLASPCAALGTPPPCRAGQCGVAVGSPPTCTASRSLAPPSRPSPPWVRQLSDDTAPCHQQLPLCQPPKPLPVPLQMRAGEDGEARRGVNCQRRAGKKEKVQLHWASAPGV